jgi:hypothetical protein
MPALALDRKDLEFTIRRGGAKLGVLKVSRGALVWRSKSYQHEYRVTWSSLDRFAVENGRKLRVRA